MQNTTPQSKGVDDGGIAMEEGIQVEPPPLKTKSTTIHLDILRSAREGRKDLLEAFLDDNLADALEYNLSSPKYAGYAVLGACSGGCNEVLDWLAERSIYPTSYGGISVRAAAGGGHVTTLEWLKEHGVEMHHGGSAALSRAAENGHVAVLEWLAQEGLRLEAAGPELARSSARRLDMLKWMDHKFGRDWTKQHAMQATIGAAESGSVDVLEWLRKRIFVPPGGKHQLHNNPELSLHNPDVFMAAIRGNQLSTLEWLERKGFMAHQNGKEGAKEATVLGHHEIAQWIRDRNCFAPQSCFGTWWAKLFKRSHDAPKEEKDISEDDDALIEAV